MAGLQHRVDELRDGLDGLRRECETKRGKLTGLRAALAERRRRLAEAKLAQPSTERDLLGSIQGALATLHSSLGHARTALISELVEVFNIVQVGGRPPIGGKAGFKGEWTIGGLILPVPGDMRRYPPDHINAVVTHTIHFLELMSFYLGIKLPFEIIWKGPQGLDGKLGVGTPWIGAGKGAEWGGWARYATCVYVECILIPPSSRYTSKHPLHLSAQAPSSQSPSQPDAQEPITALSDSVILAPEPQTSFNTALSMLIYNVCYLSYTQNVEIPLSQAGDVLSSLWGICCATELGRHSHATGLAPPSQLSQSPAALLHTALPAPTPPSFLLDFGKVLQAMSSAGSTRARARGVVSRTSSTTSSSSKTKEGRRRIRKEEPPIEEEGWDVVDEEEGL